MADSASPELRELYRERRSTSPVFYDEQIRSWFIYRHDDVKASLADWQSFSSDFQNRLPGSPFARTFTGMLIGLDPPRQTQLRALVSRAFTSRSVAELAPRITAVVERLVAEFKERGECELVEEFAGVVPVLALADLLGVPSERQPYFRSLVLRATRVFESATSNQPLDQRPHEELEACFQELIEERRKAPREDLISRLIAAEVDGERLAPHELTGMCKLLLVAGIGTIARLISVSILTLLEHPEELARLRADLSLLPSAIEEVLRFRPPVNVWFRVSARDVELRGQTIPAGQQVLLVVGSANRDERCFAEPDRFDITRSPNPHVSFSNGVHFCIGAPLARLEAKLALTALLEAFPHIERAAEGPPAISPGLQANGLVSLPLRLRA